MTIEESYKSLIQELQPLYPLREAKSIANLILEKITGYTPTMRIIHKKNILTAGQNDELEQTTASLLRNIPLQYVLEEAWFFGLPFYVDKSVLIPRPETEELVEWVLENAKEDQTVLDIGTGSGCIAIAIKKKNQLLDVWALDKFSEALQVARKNVEALNTNIHFIEGDLMEEKEIHSLPDLDIIVSNPPYIPLKERVQMDRHVVGQEPDSALFVSDEDPLIFYKKILELAAIKLKPGGKVFVEIHENIGKEVKGLFEKRLQNVVLKKDLSGRDRMICGELIFHK